MNQICKLFSKNVCLNEETLCNNAKMTLLQQVEKENFNPSLKSTIPKNIKRPLPNCDQTFEPKVCKKVTQFDSLQLFSVRKQKYIEFSCYTDSDVFPRKFANKTIERKQDDDCDSDQEVLNLSQKFMFEELLRAMSKENNQQYQPNGLQS